MERITLGRRAGKRRKQRGNTEKEGGGGLRQKEIEREREHGTKEGDGTTKTPETV